MREVHSDCCADSADFITLFILSIGRCDFYRMCRPVFISDEKIDGLAGVLLNFSHKIFGHLHRNAADLIDVITDFDSVALRGGVLNKR